MKKSKNIEVQPFTLKHQYASSPYFSQYISYGAHKDNLSKSVCYNKFRASGLPAD